MNLLLQAPHTKVQASLSLPGSKSESNRLLLLQALYPQLHLHNLSNSDDTRVMQQALQTTATTINVHHAGTAMRFLTAFFAMQEGREVLLTGSSRMKERPIGILTGALRQLGANISYIEKEGFPPLRICGRKLTSRTLTIAGDVSSQYLSALLLIAPRLSNGLELRVEGETTSLPYLKMTLALLEKIGVETFFGEKTIWVGPLERLADATPREFTVESDWSSASYFYSLMALAAPGSRLALSSYRSDSLQGDAMVARLYEPFGVKTVFSGDAIVLTKEMEMHPGSFTCDLSDTPDIAQTLAVSCLGLGVNAQLTGLHTLPIKETDRLRALKNELSKVGATVQITPSSLSLQTGATIPPYRVIQTYADHRMAMAFAPLALKVPLIISDAGVVSKSYPRFWEAFAALSFKIEEVS